MGWREIPETERRVRVCTGKNEKNENEKTEREKRLHALLQTCFVFLASIFRRQEEKTIDRSCGLQVYFVTFLPKP